MERSKLDKFEHAWESLLVRVLGLERVSIWLGSRARALYGDPPEKTD